MWAFFEKVFSFLTADLRTQFEKIATNQSKLEELIMGIKEDFATFVTGINTSLDEIQADIERLKSASTTTPPEVLAQMQAIQDKLNVIRNLDNPATPTPEEPPL